MLAVKSLKTTRLVSYTKQKAIPLSKSLFSTIPEWATYDPRSLGETETIYNVKNIVDGKWVSETQKKMIIPNPMDKNKYPIFTIPDTQTAELQPFIESMSKIKKSGVHNPLKNVHRYLEYGEITRQAGAALLDPDIAEFFTQSIIKCVPKSHGQALGEVKVTANFLNNFASDNVRFLNRDFGVPGDHDGQKSCGYRWPYGPVSIIAPFNFPLEIPVLQLMGALYMGNKPLLKPAEKVSIVMEQFLHLLHACGMPKEDVDFLNCQGNVMTEFLSSTPSIRLTQFTGSSKVAEFLSKTFHGKIKIEDAGFDWKILGPDVSNVDYIAWQCDQDAYAASGQKCSAQSILFMHENWVNAGLLDKIKSNAEARSLDDLTVGPVLTHTTKDILGHVDKILSIPGSKIICGGKEIENHSIPDVYGAVYPTAVYIPLTEMMKEQNFNVCTTEIFAPFQVITDYDDSQLELVLEACERMSHHLTAALVSNDVKFRHKVLSNTVNGTTYSGSRARTTGAPQNHWFGPAGDTRGAGIGTPEAIKLVWSTHREIITDELIPDDWEQPNAT